MKKLALIAIAVIAFSCKQKEAEPFGKETETPEAISEGVPAETQTPEKLGETIFNGKGTCVSCHKADEKLIGPSLKDIAKIYKDKNASMVSFLKGEGEAIVDPSQFALMQPNLELTKTFSDEELKALEAYVYSNLK